MRLLHARTLELRSFEENEIPRYAILSHTWGPEEVSFQEIQSPGASQKAGYAKIKFTCEEALRRGLEYAWIDTCCIDKSSSAELSEAINSMFSWYKDAKECYAYLSDVPNKTDIQSDNSAFNQSRWFTRGWTLQELLAPKFVYFFSGNGQCFGTKQSLATEISLVTGIGKAYLIGYDSIHSASISRRMSWASNRITTRTEDLAYCLIGIFGINIPLLYGEGRRAFTRLQEEIMKSSDDQTLFAWEEPRQLSIRESLTRDFSLFAQTPKCFQKSGDFIPDELNDTWEHYFLTNKGLNISLPVKKAPSTSGGPSYAVLACRPRNEFFQIVAIPIRFYGPNSCARIVGSCCLLSRDEVSALQIQSLRFLTIGSLSKSTHLGPLGDFTLKHMSILLRKLPSKWVEDLEVEPSGCWDPHRRIISRLEHRNNLRVIHVRILATRYCAVVIYPYVGGETPWQPIRAFNEQTPQPLSSYAIRPPRSVSDNCTDVNVVLGEAPIWMSTGDLILPLDIEQAVKSLS